MFLLSYLGKMMLASGILMTYYWFFLRNKKFHHYNRFYLLSTLALSLMLPLPSLPVSFNTEKGLEAVTYKVIRSVSLPGSISWKRNDSDDQRISAGDSRTATGTDASVTGVQPPASSSASGTAPAPPGTGQAGSFPMLTLVAVLYGCGVAYCLFALLRSLFGVMQLRGQFPPIEVDGVTLYPTDAAGTPFSFFRLIFWHRGIDLTSEAGQQIFRHEVYHVQNWHSLDRLVTEIVCAVCWFNPFLHLLKKELTTLHEFLADRHATRDCDRADYAKLVVLQAAHPQAMNLSHRFSNHPIKRRITMILSTSPTHYDYLRRLMALPLVLLLAGLLAIKAKAGLTAVVLPPAISQLPEPGHQDTAKDRTKTAVPPSMPPATAPVRRQQPRPDTAFVRKLLKEISTMDQVLARLGPPATRALSSEEGFWRYNLPDRALDIHFNLTTDSIVNFGYHEKRQQADSLFQYETVKSIKVGVTGMQDIIRQFGKPSFIAISPDTEVWEYRSADRALSVSYDVKGDQQKKVRGFHYNDEALANKP